MKDGARSPGGNNPSSPEAPLKLPQSSTATTDEQHSTSTTPLSIVRKPIGQVRCSYPERLRGLGWLAHDGLWQKGEESDESLRWIEEEVPSQAKRVGLLVRHLGDPIPAQAADESTWDYHAGF